MPAIRVLVGVPCSWDVVPVPFVQSLLGLRLPPRSEVRFVRAWTLDRMRNMLAEQALQEGFSHLFMLDADMIYPSESLYRLLRANVDVVSGLACRRTPPHVPICLQPTDQRFVFRVEVPEKKGLVECGAVGAGGTLIRTEVFRRLEPPYFSFQEQGPDGQPIGEDLYFCQKARDAGFRVFCLTDLTYVHLVTVGVVVDERGDIVYRPLT